MKGFEPPLSSLQMKCLPTRLHQHILESVKGFEPPMLDLQSRAFPLGDTDILKFMVKYYSIELDYLVSPYGYLQPIPREGKSSIGLDYMGTAPTYKVPCKGTRLPSVIAHILHFNVLY